MKFRKIDIIVIVLCLLLSACSQSGQGNENGKVEAETENAHKTAGTEEQRGKVEIPEKEETDEDYSENAYEFGKILYDLKLFNGISSVEYVPNLDGDMNREEAMKMIVSALGWEPASSEDSPFSDLSDWAKPYVGSAYKKGIALGTIPENNIFGAKDKVSMRQLLTFYLRALGYETTYAYNNAYKLGEVTGLTNGIAVNEDFLKRYHLVLVTYNAMKANKLGSALTLAEELAQEGKIDKKTAAELGIIKSFKYQEQRDDGTYLLTEEEIKKVTEENEKAVIILSTEDQWKKMQAEMDFAAVSLADEAKIARVIADENENIQEKYEIISLPSIKFYKNGKGSLLPDSIDGEALVKWVNSN